MIKILSNALDINADLAIPRECVHRDLVRVGEVEAQPWPAGGSGERGLAVPPGNKVDFSWHRPEIAAKEPSEHRSASYEALSMLSEVEAGGTNSLLLGQQRGQPG